MANEVYLKVKEWVDKNPHGYLEQSFTNIAKECGCSSGSVDLYLPQVIANRDGVLPSEVVKKRAEAGFSRIKRKLPQSVIEKIYEYDDAGMPVRDIAYILKLSWTPVFRYIKERKR